MIKQAEKINQLEAELQMKDALLHRKSEELARAFLRHDSLEQELAFHKLETKLDVGFRQLNKIHPHPNADQVAGDGDNDQPYLGKCRLRRRSLSLNQSAGTDPQQVTSQSSSSVAIEASGGTVGNSRGQNCSREVELQQKQRLSSDTRPVTLSLNTSGHQAWPAQTALSNRPNSAPTGHPRTPASQLLPSYFRGLPLASSSPTTAIGQWIVHGHQRKNQMELEKPLVRGLLEGGELLNHPDTKSSPGIVSPPTDKHVGHHFIPQTCHDSSVTSSPATQQTSRTNATGASAVALQSTNGETFIRSESQEWNADGGQAVQDMFGEGVGEEGDDDRESRSDSGLAASHRMLPVELSKPVPRRYFPDSGEILGNHEHRLSEHWEDFPRQKTPGCGRTSGLTGSGRQVPGAPASFVDDPFGSVQTMDYPTDRRSQLRSMTGQRQATRKRSHKCVQRSANRCQYTPFCPDSYPLPAQSRSRSHSRALSEVAQSGRATVGSLPVDTLTTVTRPSPSGDDDELRIAMQDDLLEQARSLHVRTASARRQHSRPSHVRRVLPQTEEDFLSSPSRRAGRHQPPTDPSRLLQDASDAGVWYTDNEVSPPSVLDRAYSDPPTDHVGGAHQLHMTSRPRHRRPALPMHPQHRHQEYQRQRLSTWNVFEGPHQQHVGSKWRGVRAHGQRLTPRGRSLDLPVSYRRKSAPREEKQPRHRRKELSPSPSRDDELTSETLALANLTGELVGLRQGLRRTQEANSARLELALKHIALLEFELQRQRCRDHDAVTTQDRQLERSRWEKKISATLTELQQCKAGINELRNQINCSANSRQPCSHSSLERKDQGVNLEETKMALEEQKREINRLNSMLNRLVGVNPVEASVADIQQLQMDIADLNRRMKTDLPQSVGGNVESLRRCQSLQTGIARLPTQIPVVQGCFDQAGGLEQTGKSLYCSVPEHHYLEDCVNEMQLRVAAISEEHAEQRRKLRQTSTANRKLEEKLEIQEETIKQLTMQTDRLQEDQTRSKDEQHQQQHQPNTNQATIPLTKIPLAQGNEGRRHEVIADLDRLHSQVSELTRECERLRGERSQLAGEVDSFRTESSTTRKELAQLKEELGKTQSELNNLSISKQKTLQSLEELREAIAMKQSSLDKSTLAESDLESRLSRLKSEAEAVETNLLCQRKALATDESLFNERRAEAHLLNKQIEEDRARSLVLAREIGEQKADLDRIQAEKRESPKNEQERQHQLLESQFPLSALIDQRTQILQSINDLNSEKRELNSNVDSQNKALADLSKTLAVQQNDLHQLKEASRLEQTRIDDLNRQKVDLLDELRDLQSQVKTKTDRLHEGELGLLTVTAQLESVQRDLGREQSTLDRLSSERSILEGETELARQEADRLQTRLQESKREVSDLETRHQELTDAVAVEQLQLTRLTSEVETNETRLEVIRSEINSAQTEHVQVAKQLIQARSELSQTTHQLSQVTSKLDDSEQALSEQESRQSEVAGQLERLNSSVKMGHLANRTVQAERQAGDLALKTTLKELDRLAGDREKLEQEVNQLRAIRDSESANLEQQLSVGCDQLEGLEAAISQKNQELKSAKEELATVKNDIAAITPDEVKLQMAKPDKDSVLNGGDSIEAVRDLGVEQLDILKALSEAKCALADTKSALTASQRDAKRLKRRMTRELAEMERVAEEQCNRAGDLTEQLALSRRQYSQLRGKINVYALLMEEVITVASQTEMAEHGKRLEATLASVRAEISDKLTNIPTDLLSSKSTASAGNELHQLADLGTSTARSIGNSDLHQALLRQLTESFHELCEGNSPSPAHISQSACVKNGLSTSRSSTKTVIPRLQQNSVQGVPASIENATGISLTTCGTTSGLGSINSYQWASELANHQSEASTGRTSIQEPEKTLRENVQALKYPQVKKPHEAKSDRTNSTPGRMKSTNERKRNRC